MFLLLALPDGTPEQLQKLQTKTVHAQILWIGENIKKRAIAANSGYEINIKLQNLLKEKICGRKYARWKFSYLENFYTRVFFIIYRILRPPILNLSFLQSSEFAASILYLSFLQSTGRRRIFLSEEQICNLLWHS